jgi:head-tail adaptor
MKSGELDRRVTVRRATETVNDLGETIETWADLATLWMGYKAASDGEKLSNGQTLASMASRFTARWSSVSQTITPNDRLFFMAREWQITGVKTIGRNDMIEISAETVVRP